ncbi:uncharacterized protein (DUF2236 family) [Thermosipho japonicus]|uniref:Uncharacterized protein (DUF2236 family) n=1 Tax=Thermosipho japonicus TaxID=90323 RepID=A0A841GIX5_9BACT|nr:hypothetical protein [Thermosipho japonicus]MBB6062327.1 uncharacterized protein (DUF2236 family) [Thermosipho japonicus]
MSYIEAVIAIILVFVAVTAVFTSIEYQQKMYSKILERELLQLYSEDLFWLTIYNLPNTTPFDSFETYYSTKSAYVVKDFEKVRKDINCITFTFPNEKSVNIYYFDK